MDAPEAHVITMAEREAGYMSCQAARSAAARRAALDPGVTPKQVDDAGLVAAKRTAEEEGHSQFGHFPPLEFMVQDLVGDGLHLQCGWVETVLQSKFVRAVSADGGDPVGLKDATIGAHVASFLSVLDDMKLKRTAEDYRNRYSGDDEKRKRASQARLNGQAARAICHERSRFNGTERPRRDWDAAVCAAEGLTMMMIVRMMMILMAHTMDEDQLSVLETLGKDLLAAVVLFGVGLHRKRKIGFKENMLCYHVCWNHRRYFRRFRFANCKGEVQHAHSGRGLSLGGGVIGSVQSGERHHAFTKRRKRRSGFGK